MRGDRMPYDAFERLPKTDIEIGGGVIHAAFAPGDIALPQGKVLDWVRASAKAVTTYYGRFPVAALKLLMVPVMARACAAAPPGAIAAPRSACCSAAMPARRICGATG